MPEFSSAVRAIPIGMNADIAVATTSASTAAMPPANTPRAAAR